ncbi:hypothetical protein ACOMHN_057218 [Nucella lapillus]
MQLCIISKQVMHNIKLPDPLTQRLNIQSRPLQMELDDPPTKDEVAGAIAQLQCGKSAGPDGIPPEVFKVGGQPLIQKFTEFLCMCWEDGCLPQDLKDARIVYLYKGKGDKSSCDNYRCISLLSITEVSFTPELTLVLAQFPCKFFGCDYNPRYSNGYDNEYAS